METRQDQFQRLLREAQEDPQIIGLVLSGILADLFGVRAVFFLCAGLSIMLAAAGRAFLHAQR